MRLKALFLGDIRFQFKYGFYLIYFIFTLLYIGLLYAFPFSARKIAGIIMIFSDPAEIGLYFMGAIVLFEKSERVLNSIAVSPTKPFEYVFSKLLSLSVISTAVAVIIGFKAGIIQNIAFFLISIFFCSCLYSALGLIIASKISSLNGFIIASILPQLIINIPGIIWLFGYRQKWILFHPGICMIEIFANGQYRFISFFILIFWSAFFAVLAVLTIQKMFQKVGGAKL